MCGTAKFFTLEFFEQMAKEVNAKSQFKSGMGDFAGSLILKVSDKEAAVYFEIKDGQITNMKEAKAEDTADFILEGSYETWVKMGKGELMARDAITSGAVSLTGSFMTLLAYADGFGVLLQTIALTPKEF